MATAKWMEKNPTEEKLYIKMGVKQTSLLMSIPVTTLTDLFSLLLRFFYLCITSFNKWLLNGVNAGWKDVRPSALHETARET